MKFKKLTFLLIILLSNLYLNAQINSNGRDQNALQNPVIIDKLIVLKANNISISNQDYPTKDQLIYDDLIVTGGISVGYDAIDGEDFNFKTITLKENNVRLYFDDTSVDGGTFPNNDWQIVVNSNVSGGENYFAIEDYTAGVMPIKFMAGAPANSLYVASDGDVGLNTSAPGLEFHIKDNDSLELD
ncbi:MAG: hypothetical protein JXR51_16450 [Bacteroidales bacterium]|nr:hypothetical protein [Bacteroidales bacterium]MBN2758758.1 hypothetical protein [Bacteroidales bacterium]